MRFLPQMVTNVRRSRDYDRQKSLTQCWWSATAERRRVEQKAIKNGCLIASARSSSFVFMSLSEPRSHIRLLEIEAGEQDEPLSAKLIVCERRNAPPYLAISYTWGDDKDQRELLLDGRTFRAGTNCYHALWQARLHFAPCLVWIDSICINQDD